MFCRMEFEVERWWIGLPCLELFSWQFRGAKPLINSCCLKVSNFSFETVRCIHIRKAHKYSKWERIKTPCKVLSQCIFPALYNFTQSHPYFTRFHTYLDNFRQFCFLNIDMDGLESNKEIMKQKLCFLKFDTDK